MLRRLTGIAFAAAVLVTPLAIVRHASADPGGGRSTVQCNNQTFGATVIDANIVVPAGAFCDLSGTHVTGSARVMASGDPNNPAGLLEDVSTDGSVRAVIDGDVRVDHNGQFAAFHGSTVGGNVTCTTCEAADVQGSTVNGNLVDVGLSQGAFLENAHIGGNLLIHHSSDGGSGFTITGNTVGGDLTFNNNTSVNIIVGSNISNNSIVGGLACRDNTPAPTGSGNTAKTKSGQCAGL